MSATRYSIIRPAAFARASRGPLAAAALLGAILIPSAAGAQEFAYCDLAVKSQATKLQQNGDTTVVSMGERKGQGIRLTAELPDQRSTAFHNIPIYFEPGTSFYQHFRVRISGSLLGGNAPPGGADGFSFMVQNDPGGDPLMAGKIGTGNKALGAAGSGFGYWGITQSLAVELDTFQSDTLGDPDGNHLALDLGGLVGHTEDGTEMGKPLMAMPEGSTVAPFQPVTFDPITKSFESLSTSYDTRDLWIDYECSGADACTLKVYMTFNNALMQNSFADPTKPNTLPVKPDTPSMVVEGLKDIASYLNGSMGFAGFSASTGGSMDEHLVTFWVLSRKPLPDTNMNNLEDVCECATVPTACDGNVPVCDPSGGDGFCRDCMNDMECSTKDPVKPYCDLVNNGGTGACVECTSDMQCGADKPYCDTVKKTCTASCSDDAQCATTKWCDNPAGAPFGGTCMDDLPNGAAIPSSGGHTPPLEGKCTPEAGAVVCASGVCDPESNTCGLGVGQPCTDQNGDACQSGVCTPAGTCACKDDTSCGAAASGKVCDAATGGCLEGCRGSGGNACPADLVCSSKSSEVGQCVKPGTIPGPVGGEGTVEGAGLITCGASSRGGSGGEPAALMVLAALAGHVVRRRRR